MGQAEDVFLTHDQNRPFGELLQKVTEAKITSQRGIITTLSF